jgi:sec-independent protein translocase protein TatB
MFDIGWSELLVIVVVAIVVVGPKELPRLMRTFGHYAGKLRRAASDFQRQFEEAMRESELDEVRKNIENIREHTTGPVSAGKPLMLPKAEPSPSPPQVAVGAPPVVDPSPRKPRAKRAAAKSKSVGKEAASKEAATKESGGQESAETKPAKARRRKKTAEPGA